MNNSKQFQIITSTKLNIGGDIKDLNTGTLFIVKIILSLFILRDIYILLVCLSFSFSFLLFPFKESLILLLMLVHVDVTRSTG